MPQAPKKKFKDWFDQDAAQKLGDQIHAVYPEFNRKTFISLSTRGLDSLEMNARVSRFSEAFAACLPADKNKALQILTQSLPPCLPGAENITGGWLQWPVGCFIADYGLPHYETAMQAMIELTQRFSSEFAVRPFIEHEQEKTLSRLLALTTHPNPHVRRWCSEGCRPLLPWGKKLHALIADPTPVWPILEALRDDPERYVQKSVANHLNDISKHHPDLVVAHCKKWMCKATESRKWIVRHGLRTLIKEGHHGALALIGYLPAENLVSRLQITPQNIHIGDHTVLNLTLQNPNPQAQKLLVDYAVRYVRQKGKTGRKVFKWTTLELPAKEKVCLQKKHPMKITSVRALYPGTHTVEVLINGKSVAQNSFELHL